MSFTDSALVVFRSERPLWVLALSLSALAVVQRRRWQVWAFVVGQVMWCVAVLTFTAANQRFPDRISIPLFMAIGIVLIVGMPLLLNNPSTTAGTPVARWQSGVWVASAVCLLAGFHAFSCDYSPIKLSDDNLIRSEFYNSQLNAMRSVDPNGKFLCIGATLQIEWINALTTTSAFRPLNQICTGWPMLSPSFDQRLRALDVTSTVTDPLDPAKHLYFVMLPRVKPLIQRLYLRQYGIRVALDEVDVLNNSAIGVSCSSPGGSGARQLTWRSC